MRSNGKYYLSVHVETNGLNNEVDKSITEGHEIVSIGVAVCDKEFKLIDSKIIFIDNNLEDTGETWNKISKQFLQDEGVSEEDAVVEFADFILQYFDPDDNIVTIGQNPHAFALPFLKKLLYKYEVYIRFSSNSLDLFSLTTPTIGEMSIREIIDIFGKVDNLPPFFQQQEYACLLKAITFIQTFRRIEKTWMKILK